jgi:hypothetical protein
VAERDNDMMRHEVLDNQAMERVRAAAITVAHLLAITIPDVKAMCAQ